MPESSEINWNALNDFVNNVGQQSDVIRNSSTALRNFGNVAQRIFNNENVDNFRNDLIRANLDQSPFSPRRNNVVRENTPSNLNVRASDEHQKMSKKICELTGENKSLKNYLHKIMNSKGGDRKEAIKSVKILLECDDKPKTKKTKFEMISNS